MFWSKLQNCHSGNEGDTTDSGNEGDRAESGDQLSDEDESDEDKITHAVPFKCIGAAHEKNYPAT